jgi:DNA-binding NarL/FixJ family response regulator
MLGGGILISERIARARSGANRVREADPGAPLGTLTDRELEVFDLIRRGMNSGAIAPQLQVSVEGIQTYRSNIKAKLNSRAPPI